ncbi:hypothetical protein RP726_03845 [Candidatus Methylospira mobilis]|uniref:hypothetical protein n=1 Tax=Candidatus Methylospira mobilis TaxID=1808979 RepID=UPI0028E664D9|nr:hypothetical protein [Candidatus Methylospira mobilis]WNV05556.1 hypothetical protein RP726_03845 [Candidatus Methylospira mobilis]
MNDRHRIVKKTGDTLVDMFHFLALFCIGSTIVWSALHDYIEMMKAGHATLEDNLKGILKKTAQASGRIRLPS